MLTENFVAATLAVNKPSAHISSALKDGYKKSSVKPRCLAISENHVFAAQAEKAVINVYNRGKTVQEATVPFPERIHSLAFVESSAILVIGTEGGKIVLWEIATGRLSTSTASHIQAVSSLCVTRNGEYIISGSADASVHVWSLSNLVSFSQPDSLYTNGTSSYSPVRTFSSHRTAITALACGHSGNSTNFVVSSSKDQTCYIWHLETCQILRTVLLPFTPLCLTVDPVDRAVYTGHDDGSILAIDIFGKPRRGITATKTSLFELNDTAPVQIDPTDCWLPSAADIGSTLCLAISYDGTNIISGHTGGFLIRWDVAKHRMLSTVMDTGQPVTNVRMLKPDRLNSDRPNFTIPAIVKPKLEFNAQNDYDSSNVPGDYTFQAQIVQSPLPSHHQSQTEFEIALRSATFPQNMLDDALRTLLVGSQHVGSDTHDTKIDQSKVERLEEEVRLLQNQHAILKKVEEERMERKVIRAQKMEDIGLRKRQAFLAAKKKGLSGDAAMKDWEDKEDMLRMESDDEYAGVRMDEGG